MRGTEVGLKKTLFIFALITVAGLTLIVSEPAFAQTPGGVSNVENFIRSVITVLAGLAGLVATGFFVAGGFTYITSSGNPKQKGSTTVLPDADRTSTRL